MKYSITKLKCGMFAVSTGKRHYPHTKTTNELHAKQQALIMSMGFYQDQIDKAFNALELTCTDINSLGEIKLEGSDHYTDKGDLLC